MPYHLSNRQVDDSGYSFSWIRKVLVLLSLCVFIAAMVTQAISTWRSYQSTLAKAEQEMLLLARTFEEHVGRTMDGTLSSLNTIEQDEVFQSCVAARDNGCLHAYMLRFVGRYPQLQSMDMVYENGELAASSLAYPVRPHNLSNTQYFRVARSRPQAPYYIAEQQIDPTGSSPIIPFVTGVLDKKALFSGVLIAGLNPEHYQKFYTSISQNRDLVMRLFRDDGISLSRYPYIAEEIGRDISHKEFFDRVSSGTESGVFYETSKIDNINRIYGWRRVEGWPLGVSVGVNRDAVLAPWWRETIIALGISLFLLLGGTLLIIYVLRQLTRLERTEADLYLTKVAVERGADMAIWLDPAGHIRYVNATTCNRFGFSEQDLLAMRFRDINPSFKPESWPKFWGRLRQHRHLFDEIVLRTRTG